MDRIAVRTGLIQTVRRTSQEWNRNVDGIITHIPGQLTDLLKGVGVAGALPQSDLETIAVTLWEKHNQLCELDVALKKTLLDYRYRNGADLMLSGRPAFEQLGARL